MYKDLNNDNVKQFEQSISKYWDNINLLDECVNTREGKESFVFYDGPPTANGKPGIHHVIARALKDSVCRYKTMQGYQVKRKAGWDTHGLPVEIEVEKRLSLNNKQEIEDYGIEKFNQKCRDSVFEYESAWREQTERMAYLIDLDNPYITLDNNYIESVWWILDKFNKEGYFYEGHKILPYCTRCGTGLASHEVAQGYQEIKSLTVISKFKLVDKDEYFLVWTTTPWTLAANVALAVNPEVDYIKVKSAGEVYYVAKALADTVLDEEYEVIAEMKGKDLEYLEYEQLMDFVQPDKKAFFVTCADYVSTEDGTGIVHLAPAFGEDDYNVGVEYNLPVLQPVNEDGKYVTTPWKDMFVMDADLDIVKWLHAEEKLYKKQKMAHNYPHCWRCKTPLLYYAKPSWYIEMTRLKDQLIENNNTVNWHPDFVGQKRFGDWLENLNDWAISRSRYWGTPLNIWRCDCGHFDTVGSRQELADKAIENIDPATVELHRPYVDDIHIACEKCGETMERVPDVIDCWFDSGSMPFAQHHYPFENKENFDELFPADYICEGIDQTRGWFYSLLAISTFVMGKSPYKNVLVNDLILDKEGKKMSKSKGNTADAIELFDKYGADTVRWYLYYVSPPWTPTKFDEEGVKEVYSKYTSTINNVYNFFKLYANTDNVNVKDFYIEPTNRPNLDQWILSKVNNLIKTVQGYMEEFHLTNAVRAIQSFVDEELSNWYIRRSRRRFWAEELTDDKKAVYNTTSEVLETIAKLSAPFAPYLSEQLYRNLTDGKSVHLAEYPVVNEELINAHTEEQMDIVKDLVALGRASRESVNIKVRQPLSKVLVDGRYEELINDLLPLMKEELNVKSVEFVENLDSYMNFSLKPNFRKAGPVLGKNVGAFNKALSQLNANEIVPKINNGETITIDLNGEEFKFDSELVLVNMDAKDGFTVQMEKNLFTILETELSRELVDEGLAREFISRVQRIRKAKDFEMMDNIKIEYVADEEFTNALKVHCEYVKSETLALEVTSAENNGMESFDLNGHEVKIYVEKL